MNLKRKKLLNRKRKSLLQKTNITNSSVQWKPHWRKYSPKKAHYQDCSEVDDMALPNAYEQYNNSKILTASPAELTLMLYDGAIKFCNIAIMGIEQKDVQKAHDNIVKVQRIIDEFRSTLDHKYPVAEDFDRVYVYILRRLFEANVKKDKEILEEVLVHLRSMRDTWKEVMQKNRVAR